MYIQEQELKWKWQRVVIKKMGMILTTVKQTASFLSQKQLLDTMECFLEFWNFLDHGVSVVLEGTAVRCLGEVFAVTLKWEARSFLEKYRKIGLLASIFCEVHCLEATTYLQNLFVSHYSKANASSETTFGHLTKNACYDETSI